MKIGHVQNNGKELRVGNIFCIGRNYADHAKEMQSEAPQIPIVFLKPASALLRDGEDIVIPNFSNDMHHEVELVAAIGTEGRNIAHGRGLEFVLGYGIGLDMTLRDVQNEAKKKGLPWTVAKGFDTSAPVSEIIPASSIKDPHNLTFRCSVNGKIRQESSTKKMIFSIDRLIEYISSIFTLGPGDLIFTGTPEGVGQVKPGDRIEAELVGYTKITHHIVSS